MKIQHRKSIATVLLLVSIAVVNILATEKYDQDYKNLQILPKDIKQPELKKIMDGFCASLGVKCGFCHVRNQETREWDYASDQKNHKNDARDMMRMTADLNTKYFGVDYSKPDAKTAVNCYTCHRGEEHPEVFPPVDSTKAQ